MFCQNCGMEVASTYKMCTKCGEKQFVKVRRQQATTSQPEPLAPKHQEQTATPKAHCNGQEQLKLHGIRRFLFHVVGILAILFLALDIIGISLIALGIVEKSSDLFEIIMNFNFYYPESSILGLIKLGKFKSIVFLLSIGPPVAFLYVYYRLIIIQRSPSKTINYSLIGGSMGRYILISVVSTICFMDFGVSFAEVILWQGLSWAEIALDVWILLPLFKVCFAQDAD